MIWIPSTGRLNALFAWKLKTKNYVLQLKDWTIFSKKIPKIYGNGVDYAEAGHGVLFNFLKGKAAKYHKSCLDKYNDRMVQRSKEAYAKRGDGGKEIASTNTDTDLSSLLCKR